MELISYQRRISCASHPKDLLPRSFINSTPLIAAAAAGRVEEQEEEEDTHLQ